MDDGPKGLFQNSNRPPQGNLARQAGSLSSLQVGNEADFMPAAGSGQAVQPGRTAGPTGCRADPSQKPANPDPVDIHARSAKNMAYWVSRLRITSSPPPDSNNRQELPSSNGSQWGRPGAGEGQSTGYHQHISTSTASDGNIFRQEVQCFNFPRRPALEG